MTIIFFNFMDLVNHDNLQACLTHNNNQNRKLYRKADSLKHVQIYCSTSDIQMISP